MVFMKRCGNTALISKALMEKKSLLYSQSALQENLYLDIITVDIFLKNAIIKKGSLKGSVRVLVYV